MCDVVPTVLPNPILKSSSVSSMPAYQSCAFPSQTRTGSSAAPLPIVNFGGSNKSLASPASAFDPVTVATVLSVLPDNETPAAALSHVSDPASSLVKTLLLSGNALGRVYVWEDAIVPGAWNAAYCPPELSWNLTSPCAVTST